jgi:hypothetical protein
VRDRSTSYGSYPQLGDGHASRVAFRRYSHRMTKKVNWAYVSDLGKRIERSAEAHMPRAKQLAADAQNDMMSAGSGGGMFVVASFFFGAEYVERSYEIKQEVSVEINNAAQKTSKIWEAAEGSAPMPEVPR